MKVGKKGDRFEWEDAMDRLIAQAPEEPPPPDEPKESSLDCHVCTQTFRISNTRTCNCGNTLCFDCTCDQCET